MGRGLRVGMGVEGRHGWLEGGEKRAVGWGEWGRGWMGGESRGMVLVEQNVYPFVLLSHFIQKVFNEKFPSLSFHKSTTNISESDCRILMLITKI